MFSLLKYRHGARSSGSIALTFDDGPSDHTSDVLGILKKYSVAATFFLIPENVERLLGVAKRILDEGHEVGGHVAQPPGIPHWKSLFGPTSERKVLYSLQVMKERVGVDVRFFRPSPDLGLSGYTLGAERLFKRLDLIPILTSAYSLVTKPPDRQFREITNRLRGGDIVLLHDGHDLLIHSLRPRDTIRILPGLIELARKKNLAFATVSELLGIRAYK